MSDALAGVTVLDLSRGVAGPMVTMLMADHGADVTRIDAPGDPYAQLPAYRVWNRGKRSAALDLRDGADRDRVRRLAAHADVVVESFAPGVAERFGLDQATLRAANPRLVHCSITGYGVDTRHSDRPGHDLLVAARSGLVWEKRGIPGGRINRLAAAEVPLADLDVPAGAVEGPDRGGPLASMSPWSSLGAFYHASVGINAALRARELTGRGQWVQASLLQGAIAAGAGGWQRVQRPDAAGYQSWIFDGRAPMLGIFRCADGRWVHNWVCNPRFVLSAAEGERLTLPDGTGHRDDPTRIGTDPDNLVVVLHYFPQLVEAFARFPSDEWVATAARFGTPLQPVRAPREALADPSLRADGCVAVLDDPQAGPVAMVGSTYRLSFSDGRPRRAAPVVGEHTALVRAEADALPPPPASSEAPAGIDPLAAPLAGIRVLDLGLAIAGPYGTQVLADLGADVVKVNAPRDVYWQGNHIAFTANRGKRSLGVDLKTEGGMAVLRRLVETADVVHHNMRPDAAARLGVDEASLRAINPRLIHCHTRGFEHGDRDGLPANDQTGACLAGNEWEDGGLGPGPDPDPAARPMWSRTSFGDTGNGYLSAIGVIQALRHRDRTGEGSTVDTSILYAQLLNASYTYLAGDGTEPDRPRLDAGHHGLNALYRLYACADGWLAVAATRDRHWAALCGALDRPDLATDPRFARAADRAGNDDALAAELEAALATAPVAAWAAALDAAGVPCEPADVDAVEGLLDDPDLYRRGWLAAYEHPVVGRIEQAGLGVDLSDTPGVLRGPTPVVGQHTRELLAEAGYGAGEIDRLVAAGAVFVADVPAAASAATATATGGARA